MSAPTGATSYSFAGSTFYRLVSGDYPPWFNARQEYTQDLVLDSTQDYLDLAATAYESLALRAVVFSAADRSALLELLGTTAVFSTSSGRSQAATLVSASAVDLGLPGFFAMDLTFIRRPTGSA